MSQLNREGLKGFAIATTQTEGKIVKVSAAGTVVLAAAATDKLIGVLNSDVTANDTASVALRSSPGTFKVLLGGTVTLNAYITTNATGLGIATVTTGNEILGQALEAGVAGDLIEVVPMNRLHA